MPEWMTPLLCPVWCCAIACSFSSTVRPRPGRRLRSSRATASPRMPAPTTTTSARVFPPGAGISAGIFHDRPAAGDSMIPPLSQWAPRSLAALLSLPLVAAAMLGLLTQASAADAESIVCGKFASPAGSDDAGGGVNDPYRTVGRLAQSLHAGEMGCLLDGTYTG